MNDKTAGDMNTGRQYWQSLQELAETPAVRAAIETEFPTYDPDGMVSQSRRKFLQLAGASMALAGVTLTGCRRWPKENVVEQTSRPQGRVPGVPEHYATAYEIGGYAQPLLVSTYDGRPIKVEGNPLHPQCRTFGGKLGASTLYAQASLLEMYDPERSRSIVARREGNRVAVSQPAFIKTIQDKLAAYKTNGSKLAVLAEASSSPTTQDALNRFAAAFPGSKIYSYEAISADNQYAANRTSFGQPVRQVFDLSKAEIVVSFDADLLGLHPYALRHANDWAQKRKSADTSRTMNRMYVVESMFSTTGTVADERFPASTRKISSMVLQLAHEAGLESGQESVSREEAEFIHRVWTDLAANAGKAIVAGGFHLPAEVLGVINAINARLGAIGTTINLQPEPDRATYLDQIKALVAAISAGQVETLIMLGGNPVYDAPADLEFRKAIGDVSKVGTTLHLSLYDNETSEAAQWHVNRAHYLESWGDSIAWDGTVCLQQPMIKALFNGYTPGSLLSSLLGETPASVMTLAPDSTAEMSLDQAIVYRTWQARLKDPFVATSKAFRQILHDGFAAQGEPPVNQIGRRDWNATVQKPTVSFGSRAEGYELRLVPDYKLYDGRFANNGWLQEVPDPVTKISWDNAALLNYNDAKRLGIFQDDYSTDLIELTVGDRKVTVPGYIMPAQPEGVITLPLGYGRTQCGARMLTERAGSIGSEIGYNSYLVRTTANPWVGYGVAAAKTGERCNIATTQAHNIIEPMGFEIREQRIGKKSQPGQIVHETTLTQLKKDAHAPHKNAHVLKELQLWPGPFTTPAKRDGGPTAFNDPHAWGMAIDMNTCIGCNACVVACQAENNIPIVGKEQVIRNREMHWLRIDRYFKSSGATYEEKISDPNPQVTFQPMMCVHCENAPCEQVCPVAATVHDTEGLNTMVYNRCIGTRYCSNNCPYKVRRFNYLDYQSKHPRKTMFPWLGMPDTQQEQSVDHIKRLMFNPDVTVRMRGVMEKCTYCTQRIKAASIPRRNE
ncbi:MAG: TAT-variant-translocated molybdopterin oxidoreductase, partial [Burkholderiales bacterium]|nr:TAT-variant-translocated molybdopterin oxidoreductase [Phycisphaerae bacterium]